MERQDAAMTILQDHVIVAVFAEIDSPLIGLRNLVMPIRASNIDYKDLIHVVIVGNVDYLKSKWLIYTTDWKYQASGFEYFVKSEFERELLMLDKQMIPHFLALDVSVKICQEQLSNSIRDDHATFLVKNALFKE